jgi:hypothetical protein
VAGAPRKLVEPMNFVHALLLVKGRLVEMLLQIDPHSYAPFVTGEWGAGDVQGILMALPRLNKSPLLFYRKFRKDIES